MINKMITHTYYIDGKPYIINIDDSQEYSIDYGEVLIFSSHLVHGLAINEESDTTRVALEFRLYKKT
jgi:ectoine hydroxylase-related dioxygenase (phytanoyl-CoA dioxygenase family)